MPDTLNFSGDFITFLGFVGVMSTFAILVAVFVFYWNSPYNR